MSYWTEKKEQLRRQSAAIAFRQYVNAYPGVNQRFELYHGRPLSFSDLSDRVQAKLHQRSNGIYDRLLRDTVSGWLAYHQRTTGTDELHSQYRR